jgi:hypothetical protein
MAINSKVVKKTHVRKIKSKGSIKTVRVKAATKGSVQKNKAKRKKQ